MNNSINHYSNRKLNSSQNHGIFDLTKLQEYPLRLLYINLNENNGKSLFFRDVKIEDIFPDGKNKTSKYLLIGNMNRTNLSSEYIVENVEELYEAIQKYIAGSLLRRTDPLEYYFIGFTKLYNLREYKRLFAKGSPLTHKQVQ